MTDLSPQAQAAQAVLDAFNERHELCGPFDGNWQELCLAAALRAAENQLSRSKFIYAPQLRAIAAELEGKGND